MSNRVEESSGYYDPVLEIAGRRTNAILDAEILGRALEAQKYTEQAPYEILRIEKKLTVGVKKEIKRLNNERFRLTRQLAKTTDQKAKDNLQAEINKKRDEIKGLKSQADSDVQANADVQDLNDSMVKTNKYLAFMETSAAQAARNGQTRDYLRTVISTSDTAVGERVKLLREAEWARVLNVKGFDSSDLMPSFVSGTAQNLGRLVMPTTTYIGESQF